MTTIQFRNTLKRETKPWENTSSLIRANKRVFHQIKLLCRNWNDSFYDDLLRWACSQKKKRFEKRFERRKKNDQQKVAIHQIGQLCHKHILFLFSRTNIKNINSLVTSSSASFITWKKKLSLSFIIGIYNDFWCINRGSNLFNLFSFIIFSFFFICHFLMYLYI